MTDPAIEPDPKIVRRFARELLQDAAGTHDRMWACRNIGAVLQSATFQAEFGRALGMVEYNVWFEAVCEAMQSAQFAVSWPDEKPAAEPDLSGWSEAENAEFEKMYGVRAAMRLRAANDRVWAIVQDLRSEAVNAGRDPYQDPMAQRLSAALVGVDDA